jgi:hypothetical protein
METIIVLCLLIIIVLLLQDKIVTKKREKKPTEKKSNPNLPDIMGQPRPVRSLSVSNTVSERQTQETEVNPDNLDIEIDEEDVDMQIPPEEPETLIKPLKKKPLAKERNKSKKANDQDYESIFFKKPSTNARDGKTVYIRPDFYEKMSRIVQVIGEDKITIYAYLDNLLEYHFQEFGEQITTSFNDKYKPIL